MFNCCPINERNINIFPQQKPEQSTDTNPDDIPQILARQSKGFGSHCPSQWPVWIELWRDHSVTHYGMINTKRGSPSDQSEDGHTQAAVPHLLTHHQPLRRAMLQLGGSLSESQPPKASRSPIILQINPNPQNLAGQTESP